MKCLHFLLASVFVTALQQPAAAWQTSKVHIRIIESDTRNVTPAMICITHVRQGTIHVPPAGELAGAPTYPDVFFRGISFSKDKNWIGPVRKMSGKGAVNGQRTYVYGLSPSLPYFPEPVMYQVSGDFSIELAAGVWRFSIQHGNEYVPVIAEVNISGKQPVVEKTFVLKRWISLPAHGWYSGDVHAHHPLNKRPFEEFILQLAKAEDIHVLNMLQMGDRRDVYFQPKGFGRNFHITSGDIYIVAGQEEPRSEYGHVIGLNIDSLARDTAHYDDYDRVFAKLHRKPQALAGFAHFAYGGEGVREGLAMYAPTGAVDFVELLQNTKLNTQDYYEYLNLGFRFAAAAGSDFPWGSTAGDGRTFVYTGAPFSADKWFDGLKSGKTFVSNGPALFLEAANKLPGSEIETKKGSAVTVSVSAFSHPGIGTIQRIVLNNNDGILLDTGNLAKSDSFTVTFSHTLVKSQWLTAAVYCDNGALAHTSPVYFVVDGKPVYDAAKGPAIINKLLDILEKAGKAEANRNPREEGTLQRINTSKQYYKRLRAEMIDGEKARLNPL